MKIWASVLVLLLLTSLNADASERKRKVISAVEHKEPQVQKNEAKVQHQRQRLTLRDPDFGEKMRAASDQAMPEIYKMQKRGAWKKLKGLQHLRVEE